MLYILFNALWISTMIYTTSYVSCVFLSVIVIISCYHFGCSRGYSAWSVKKLFPVDVAAVNGVVQQQIISPDKFRVSVKAPVDLSRARQRVSVGIRIGAYVDGWIVAVGWWDSPTDDLLLVFYRVFPGACVKIERFPVSGYILLACEYNIPGAVIPRALCRAARVW